MNTQILYYLSHPYTSYGDKDKNREDALEIECDLVNDYNLSVINPVGLPLGDDEEKAIKKCRSLCDACDAIILCEGWEKSKGCMQEYKWAVEDGKPVYLYRDRDGKIKKM